MSRHGWFRPGMKRLEFGGGPSRKKEILLGAALGVVVIGALVLALYGVFKGDRPPVETYHFQCQECQYEFERKNDELPDYWYEFRPIEPHRLDCPKCEAKRSCVRMQKCPKCKKWFVPSETDAVLLCPHCGVNIAEYMARQARK